MRPVSITPQRTGRSPVTRPEIHRPILTYPGWDVLSQQDHWDDATRRLILERVYHLPPIQFFDASEVLLLQAIADRLLPQDDRPENERIPIVPWIDYRCHHRITGGTRYAGMPSEEQAWRMGLRGIDQAARIIYGAPFLDLTDERRDEVLQTIRHGDPPGEIWQSMDARRFWNAILIAVMVEEYYSHPTSWNEIGFGGPAYPRGYVALNHGHPEPWEKREVRLDATPD